MCSEQGKFAINTFVLITGYFMCTRKVDIQILSENGSNSFCKMLQRLLVLLLLMYTISSAFFFNPFVFQAVGAYDLIFYGGIYTIISIEMDES